MYQTDYAVVPANEILGLQLGANPGSGGLGVPGEVISRVVVTVTAVLTGQVILFDALVSIQVLLEPGTPAGVYPIELGERSIFGGWFISTPAEATVLAVGRFI